VGRVKIAARTSGTLAPPATMLDEFAPAVIEVAKGLAEWAIETFAAELSPLFNERHTHLREAKLGALWTNVPNISKQARLIGQAEIPRPPVTGGRWARARWEHQLVGWFGEIPDFLLTLDAGLVAELDDMTFCSVIEHELYHCGQALDDFGAPKFTKEGKPVFGIVAHDVEEFVGIVERYGAGAAAGKTVDLVRAARAEPLIGRAAASFACGTCAQAT
jgi:hypothetical protein